MKELYYLQKSDIKKPVSVELIEHQFVRTSNRKTKVYGNISLKKLDAWCKFQGLNFTICIDSTNQ